MSPRKPFIRHKLACFDQGQGQGQEQVCHTPDATNRFDYSRLGMEEVYLYCVSEYVTKHMQRPGVLILSAHRE